MKPDIEVGKMYYVKACGNMIEVGLCVGVLENGGGLFTVEYLSGAFELKELPQEKILSEYTRKLTRWDRFKARLGF